MSVPYFIIKPISDLCGKYRFIQDYHNFKDKSNQCSQRFSLEWKDKYPCLSDRTSTTGFDRHYIYHPAWAARILKDIHPIVHVDISSTLAFCTLVSAFIPVEFYDYRPADLQLSNMSCRSADLLALPFKDSSISSLSCMHVVEHIGLGRYGDPLDPEGDLKAIAELKRVLGSGGNLLFVVPVGKTSKIMFNAHRIYTYKQITEYFFDLELREFSLIPDNPEDGEIISDATEEIVNSCEYGCGCFWFKKG
jgi:hypothetical protein